MTPDIAEWERVKMFRCVQDPMIGPKARNAFMLPDLPGWEAWFNTSSGTIYVTTDKGRRHLVGTGNWSSIELFSEEAKPQTIQEIAQTPKHRRKQLDSSGAV